MKLSNENGVIPVVIIIAIAIAAIGGTVIGFGVYMATHAFASIMVSLGFALIFVLFVLPNLSSIVLWWKNVKQEVGHSIEEIKDEDKTNNK
jgi:membrane protein implicated in regulation of membrane protease activity